MQRIDTDNNQHRYVVVHQFVPYDVLDAEFLKPFREAPEAFSPQPEVHFVHDSSSTDRPAKLALSEDPL